MQWFWFDPWSEKVRLASPGADGKDKKKNVGEKSENWLQPRHKRVNLNHDTPRRRPRRNMPDPTIQGQALLHEVEHLCVRQRAGSLNTQDIESALSEILSNTPTPAAPHPVPTPEPLFHAPLPRQRARVALRRHDASPERRNQPPLRRSQPGCPDQPRPPAQLPPPRPTPHLSPMMSPRPLLGAVALP